MEWKSDFLCSLRHRLTHVYNTVASPLPSTTMPAPPDNKKPARTTTTFDFGTVAARDEAVSAFQKAGITCKDASIGFTGSKPMLLFVNPFGGVKEAVKIYTSVISPMLDIAGIPHERVDTIEHGHAEKVMKTVELSKYSAFIAVSGDGVLHEIVNGMLSRPDWRAARTIPVGTVGAGSSNAMNRNLGHMFPEYAVLSIIKGHTRSMDVLSVTLHESKKVVFTHLNTTWAFIADVDIESDRFRWIGREKVTLSALLRLARLRRYRAHIGIQPFNPNDPPLDTTTLNNMNDPTLVDPPASPSDTASAYGPRRMLGSAAAADARVYPVQRPAAEDCVSFLTANNLGYISTDFKASHLARLRSGFLDLTMGGRDVMRVGVLKMLVDGRLPEDLENGLGIRSMLARGFRLDPLGWDWGIDKWSAPSETALEGGDGAYGRALAKLNKEVGGVVAVSGEPFKMESMTVEVHDSVLNIFTALWLNEE
ncbi:ATP-NAD kinase-like domain-containing protein [Chytriomyces sp. MP71]|nr:ATP-NAD kinase-like domain-containing protein [Chytriomyces sp. MP71]